MLIIQSMVLCVIFTLLIIPAQFKHPLSQINSYPPAIRERVANLPQYTSILDMTKKKNLFRKIIGTLIFVVLLAFIAYFSGKKSFVPAFIHVFILFFAVNIYDLFILDLLVFRNCKKVIIHGTEDMVSEYKNVIHHVKGAALGTVFSLLGATLAAGIVELISYFSQY